MTLSPLDLLEVIVETCVGAGVEYAVIGALARNAWAPPRATADVDVAVTASDQQYVALIAVLQQRRGFAAKRVSARGELAQHRNSPRRGRR